MATIGNTLGKIDRLFAEWQNLQPISKENADRLWKKFRLEWNYNSNHIEGNTLTYGETQLLLLFDKTTGDHEMREFEEMKAHDVAIAAIRQWAVQEGRDITEADIRELNQIILVRPFWKDALTYDGQPTRRLIKVGEYKEHPNSVRLSNGEMFHYASPEDVPIKMHELMDWYRENQDLPPVILAAEMHYRFILIHPFDDGNGRIARLLMNYIFIKNGLPPIIIKSADKKNYLTALNKADVGDREAFHEYIAEQLVWSLEIAVKAAKGESIEEDDDLDKEIELLSREAATSKIVSKKSKEVIQNTYLPFLKTFYDSIEKKMERFNTLFVEWDKSYVVSNNYGVESYYFSSLNELEDIILNYSHQGFYEKYAAESEWPVPYYSELQKCKMIFSWDGYKNAGLDNTFSLECVFLTVFEDFKYRISFGWRDGKSMGIAIQEELLSVEIPYNSFLSFSEMNEFINQSAKCILDRIKAMVEIKD